MGEDTKGDSPLGVLHGRFPALRSREFRLLWTGQTVSVVGSSMQSVALNWHLYLLTHSTVALGMIGLVRVIPIITFSLLGGVVADAADRRRVLITTQSALACTALALALLTHYGRITPAGIYVLTAIAAAAMAFNNPARQAIVPNLVPREHFSNAASLSSMSMQVAGIVGPALAGLMLNGGGLAAIYAINAASFLGVILALLQMKHALLRRPEQQKSDVSLAAMVEGLQFVRRTPILVWSVALDFMATFFSSANALLPVFAKDILKVGAQGYGLLSAAPAAGSLVAGAAMALLPTVRRQGFTMLVAVLFYGLATVLFGGSHWVVLSWAALAITGAADTVSTILRQTIRQLVTPDRLRGRMTAGTMIFFMGGPQLGELEAGLVARLIGAPWSVITGGIGCLVCVLWVAARAPDLRQYEDPHTARPVV